MRVAARRETAFRADRRFESRGTRGRTDREVLAALLRRGPALFIPAEHVPIVNTRLRQHTSRGNSFCQ